MTQVETLFDPRTSTLTHVVWDPETRDAVVIDPVLDYDPLRVAVFEESIDRLSAFVGQHALKVWWILETHAHADHLSAAARLVDRFGARQAAGAGMREVAEWFGPRFGVSGDGAFDRLLAQGESLEAGSIRVEAIATPGHTPACTTWLIDGRLFTGDALFLPDFGTGRCDFPGGSADALWRSIHGLYARFADDTPFYVGHDYQPGGRELRWTATLGESKRGNVHCRLDTPRDEFVAWRTGRDQTLKLPGLLFPAIQVNIQGGRLPDTDALGRVFLRFPVGLF